MIDDFYTSELYNYCKVTNDNIDIDRDKNINRIAELNILRAQNINTLELKNVECFNNRLASKLVVYTDLKGHSGQGKEIVDIETAKRNYRGMIASAYMPNDKAIKIIGVGKYRFKVYLETIKNTLKNKVISVQLIGGNNKDGAYPIYSVDYIGDNNGLFIATDFNSCEKLADYGIDKLIDKEEVVRCILNNLKSKREK